MEDGLNIKQVLQDLEIALERVDELESTLTEKTE